MSVESGEILPIGDEEGLSCTSPGDAKHYDHVSAIRLKATWEGEFAAWNRRSLAGKHYVYVWADGVHFNIRLEGGRQCILVLMGATAEGKKELIAIADGYRESEQSWRELLLDVKARGLEVEPSPAIGDGALGFWKAIGQVWPSTKAQRCWVHKMANILDKMPKGSQPKAKAALHEIYGAETRAEAEKAFELFVKTYQAKYPKATECLEKDKGVLRAFYEFPAEHWVHIRTTNPIESVFSTVMLRHDKTKGSGSRVACLTMVFKLMESASIYWRSLNGSPLLAEVVKGTVFKDGIREKARRLKNPQTQLLTIPPAQAVENVKEWKVIELSRPQQVAFATAAVELKPHVAIKPAFLLTARREEDMTDEDARRDLWRTTNVIQESLSPGWPEGGGIERPEGDHQGREERDGRPCHQPQGDCTVNYLPNDTCCK